MLLGVTVLTLFWKADDAFSKEFREEVSLRLLCLDTKDLASSWPKHFAALFDKRFSTRHLSLYCFLMSSLFSLLTVLLMSLIFLFLRTPFKNEGASPTTVIVALAGAGVLTIPSIILNFIPDYLSLLETRYLLKLMEETNSSFRLVILLVVDLLLTSCLGALVFYVGASTLSLVEAQPALDWILYGIWGFWCEKDPPYQIILIFMSLYFFSTFFTSAWIWLYAFAQGVVRSAHRLDTIVKCLQFMLPIEERPFRSIGIVATILAVGSYFVLVFIFNSSSVCKLRIETSYIGIVPNLLR